MLQWYIQPRNGYNQYYFALDSIFRRQVNITSRPGRGQKFEAEANLSRPMPRPKFWLRGQSGLEAYHWKSGTYQDWKKTRYLTENLGF